MTRDQSLVALVALCVLALVILAFTHPAAALITAIAGIGGGALGRLSGAKPPD